MSALGALGVCLTLGVAAAVLGVVCTLGAGDVMLGVVAISVARTLGAGAGVFGCCGTLGVAAVTLGAVTGSVTVACTLGTARLVVISCVVCGVAGVKMSHNCASMELVGSPVLRNGSAGRGWCWTTWDISSMAAARRSLDDVCGMLTFVGKNSTVFDTRSPWVAVTWIV